MELFEVENLTYHYPEERERALKNIYLKISEGEFILLVGASGCGKSTLLRALAGLVPHYYGGAIGGRIHFSGRPLESWDKRHLSREVGLVFQDPEQQLVMTSVEQEIAFGLENLGLDPPEMRRRVAEVFSLFNLTALRKCPTFTLSGGEKQKVVLASVLAMQPRVLLLDEPTSQLDPVSAQELLNFIQRLNLEWGFTIILVEQRMDRCFHLADRIVFMEQGRVVHEGHPREMASWGRGCCRLYMPPVARFFSRQGVGKVPLTVKEGRTLLRKDGFMPAIEKRDTGAQKRAFDAVPLLQARGLEFAYGRQSPCLKGISLSFYPGEITAILGENGAGKTTLLKTLNGLLIPQRGKIILKNEDITRKHAETLAGRIAYLSQNPNDYLFHDTVREEIAFGIRVPGNDHSGRVEKTMQSLGIGHLAGDHPRDGSTGERQRIALGTVLVTDPAVLLLDEPTRGLDPVAKQRLATLLQSIGDEGKTIVLVTHDVEFAADVAARVVILHDGQVVADGEREMVLSDSLYYAPQISRLFRGLKGTLDGSRLETVHATKKAPVRRLHSLSYGAKK